MYTSLPSFILGFHGCDQSVVDAIVTGSDALRPSENDYDWLGNGAYFWENDPARALEYAHLLKDHPIRGRGHINTPAVLGAVIDLGHCLNLMEADALRLIRTGYTLLRDLAKISDEPLPENTILDSSGGPLVRRLDCAVIQVLHKAMTDRGESSFDSVRGLFLEGDNLYPNAGFREKNHIQICVRNPNCIKGFFIPRQPNRKFPLP